jgi:endonuclease/exonuclease/phosphatase family metal-dependent hydrolase
MGIGARLMRRPGYKRAVNFTIVTWNIHGSERPDLDAIGQRLGAFGADVVALQEVRRSQARALGERLGWVTVHWSFKHWPLWNPAEGLAVLSPHPLLDSRTVTLSRGAPPWNYRRRIAQLCVLGLGEHRLRLANSHLASDDADARFEQAQRLVAAREDGSFVVGDLNAQPGRRVLRLLLEAGLRDAWAELHPNPNPAEGATSWRRQDPDDRPSQRIDYVLVPTGYGIVAAAVPSAADSDLSAYRRLSDHLPVRAELASSSV